MVLELAGSCCGGDRQVYVAPRFDTWDPSAGPFEPTWQDGVVAIWGVGPDGRTLIGGVPGRTEPEVCLAEIDPLRNFRVLRRACIGLATDLGSVSPGGRWLVVQSDGQRAYDLRSVFVRPTPTATVRDSAGDLPERWIDGDSTVIQ